MPMEGALALTRTPGLQGQETPALPPLMHNPLGPSGNPHSTSGFSPGPEASNTPPFNLKNLPQCM